MLRAAAADVLNNMPDERVSLSVDILPEAGSLTARGDEALLRRAVDNLLRNSILHTPGAVCIRLSLAADEQSWTVTVEDDGCGLDEQTMQRLRRPREDALPAHGLGLLLVQQIVFAHGGTVRFENSHPGLRAVLAFPGQEK